MSEPLENNRRKHVRHEADIPIEVWLGDLVANNKEYLNNISFGGLSFRSHTSVPVKTVIKIRIPLVRPVFEANAEVKWCQPSKTATGIFDVGVEFISAATDKDKFRIRMLEQICHIETYKHEVETAHGRCLSGEEAALEWINKFADKFPKE
jgi:hypothetical protein